MFPYDTLIGKQPVAVGRELAQLDEALRVAREQATSWLTGRLAPAGPVTAVRNVSIAYKTVWAYESQGRVEEATRVLDWLHANALRDSGDLYFDEETEFERIGLRGYRMYVIAGSAGRLGHPLASDERLVARMRQYQDPATGAGCLFVGDDPSSPEYGDQCYAGYAGFIGEYALAIGDRTMAKDAAGWLLSVIEQNASAMTEGRFYYTTDRTGKLITELTPEGAWAGAVDHATASQFGWVVGACMAFLIDYYDAIVDEAGRADEASRVLDAALRLVAFEDGAPLESYFYPSKCKIAWGAGRLLTVLARRGELTDLRADKLYRMGKRTFAYTFAGNQRPDGSWPECFFPLDATGPEAAFDYRMLKGVSALPSPEGYESPTCGILGDIEITAEFLAEMNYFHDGVRDGLLASAAAPAAG